MKKLKIIVWSLSLSLMINILFVSCAENSNNKNSWYFKNMTISKLWEYSEGESQTIAFIDTGISDELYYQLKDNIVFSYNVIESNDNVSDIHGHGTEMVSVACGNGYKGIYGIAPKAKIIIVKAVSDEGKTNNNYLYKALKLANDNGATIVNISLGGYKSDNKVINQINSMVSKNISIVAAAGDYQNKDLLFPANQTNIISVEACTKKNIIWEESNYNENSIMRMPGTDIDVLTLHDNSLVKDKANGTSQAASITSGYISIIRDYYIKHNIPFDNTFLIKTLQLMCTKNNTSVDYLTPLKNNPPYPLTFASHCAKIK